jgi:hypothetical protein
MKRKVIATIIGASGVLGMAASSYGQQVIFDNYGASPYYQVRYSSTPSLAPAGLAGLSATKNVDVEMGYVLGSVQAGFTLVPSSITAVDPNNNLSQPDGGVGANVTGWFQGPAVTISGYSSGPVSIEVLAWVASGLGAGGGTFATSDYTAVKTWTEASLFAGGVPAVNFTGMNGDIVLAGVVPTPEPTTIALLGLGAAGLVALRRRNV